MIRFIVTVVFGLFALGCAGGSGSSGFDIAEGLAIERVTESGECEEFDGLLICPADAVPLPAETATPSPTVPPATDTPTAAPTDSPTASPTDGHDVPTPAATPTLPGFPPTETATASPAPSGAPNGTTTPTVSGTVVPSPTIPPPTVSATATNTRTTVPSATPTRTIVPSLDIATNLGSFEGQPCQPSDLAGTCTLVFEFSPRGFPPETAFRVASRLLDTQDPWLIQTTAPPTLPNSDFTYVVDIPIEAAPLAADGAGAILQVVVLAFETDPGPVPTQVAALSATGADLAFAVSPIGIGLD
jgi:hypothetical protein